MEAGQGKDGESVKGPRPESPTSRLLSHNLQTQTLEALLSAIPPDSLSFITSQWAAIESGSPMAPCGKELDKTVTALREMLQAKAPPALTSTLSSVGGLLDLVLQADVVQVAGGEEELQALETLKSMLQKEKAIPATSSPAPAALPATAPPPATPPAPLSKPLAKKLLKLVLKAGLIQVESLSGLDLLQLVISLGLLGYLGKVSGLAGDTLRGLVNHTKGSVQSVANLPRAKVEGWASEGERAEAWVTNLAREGVRATVGAIRGAVVGALGTAVGSVFGWLPGLAPSELSLTGQPMAEEEACSPNEC
ncbi:uncharacterized protein LOC120638695 [Ornithorhynchus anatinus]|uniref:uncharacterized protein LOC120638695 n=1 Tax=Ornithorhynchus anatinus TaxID=9258 RepID=UPI0019D46355|nr:uncharacterized protein LOC120638695 [Ornithorhynchus anatinus]